ncbi:MAG: DUF6382 domain-containing protein [Clostridiales bacterium]|nr:DUF6382 domain-containing protein [Clostridiales bacterium]
MELFEIRNENDRKYIVCEDRGHDKKYTEQIVLRNRIEILTDLTCRNFNGERNIYYDITGLRSFSEMFTGENDRIELTDIIRIAGSFDMLFQTIDEYLLDINEVYLDQETFFYDPEIRSYKFIYIPGIRREISDFRQGIRSVWDRVIEKFDYQRDPEDLVYIYGVYQKICSNNFDMKKLFDGYEKLEEKKTEEVTDKKIELKNALKRKIYDPELTEGLNSIKAEAEHGVEGDIESEDREAAVSDILNKIRKIIVAKAKVIVAVSCGISILIVIMLMLPNR